jgi:DNA-binding winged helix-turn-helix (wHTH) protein
MSAKVLSPRELYAFGRYRLDATGRMLFRDDDAVSLSPKQIDTLIVLVRARGAVVERERLVNEVWPDTFVEDGGLSRNISVIRKALEEGHDGRAFI